MSLVNYESAIILTPVLSEAQMQEAVKTYRQLIVEQGGKIVNETNWGLTKLAYPIKKKSTGLSWACVSKVCSCAHSMSPFSKALPECRS